LNPGNPSETRNLGLLYGLLGKRRQAVALLEEYLRNWPDASDAAVIKQHIVELAGAASRWN
jgi:regulator of sirC expression with transglutaminase-like and TPR domain